MREDGKIKSQEEQDAKVAGLRYIERRSISNPETLDTIVRTLNANKAKLKRSGKTLTPMGYRNKHRYMPTENGFAELLSTENVQGVCWLIIQHQ